MFIGRTQEISFLEDYYNRQDSQLIVLYGRRGIGKTELLRRFFRDKSCLYYSARECSQREQILCMQREWADRYSLEESESYAGLLSEASKEFSLLVVDEFNLIMKNSEDFMDGILESLNSNTSHKVMIVLCSSSVRWVENEMVHAMGNAAFSIAAFQKLKELTFQDMVTYFPNYTVEECIGVYGILGGVPGYLNFWNEKRSIKENIISLFLQKESRFYKETENFLKSELRELALYNTILSVLAEDEIKQNDIYDRTGFSRSKISVYIKNLIELDLVEKLYSYETDGIENTKKGLYQIKDCFIHFWYRFVFPNLSEIETGHAEELYTRKIDKYLDDYLGACFAKVCQEYLTQLGDFKKLSYQIERLGQWHGKDGTIEILGESTDHAYFAGKCKWDLMPMTEVDFENFLELVKQAEVEPDYYYLFSKNGYTSNMELLAKGMDNLVLAALEDL